MITLPLWASALVSFGVKLVTQWLANLRAEKALRDLGAANQAAQSTAAAGAQEKRARAAGEAAAAGSDDPRDLRD